jgi:hypothetical protein
MFGAFIFIAGMLFLSGSPAPAPVAGATPPARAPIPGDPGAGYDVYSYRTPTVIPDGNRTGVTLGPIRVPQDSGEVGGVIVSISITHPSTADLTLRLGYDADNDGHPEAIAYLESHRARPGGWAVREPYACPQEMKGVYYYRDEPAGEFDDRGDASFSVFDRLPRGGSFTLTAADTLRADEGAIMGWTVFLKHPAEKLASRSASS